jgi:RNA polymerase sigma-70 factor (ECF subfamily)
MEAVLGMMMAGAAVDPVVEQLRRGDLRALDQLIDRYQYRLYRYLLRLVKNASAADDLFQQTWVLVIEKIGRYDARREFEPWLFSVARNAGIDYLRRTKTESLDDEPSAVNPDAFEQLLETERAQVVERHLEALPAMYREVLSLRFEEEMKLEQIAAVLNVPLPTVKTRLARGLEAMRQRLGGKL